VSKAKGYWGSTFLYFTYGRNEEAWLNKVSTCGARGRVRGAGDLQMTDEFEERAKTLLKNDTELLNRLLALRNKPRYQSANGGPAQVARKLNAENQSLLDKAAELLGPVRFKKLFGFAAGQKINFVDSALLQSARSGRNLQKTRGKAPKSRAKRPSVTLKILAADLAQGHHLTKRLSETMLYELVDQMIDHLRKGERVRIGKLGVLEVREGAISVKGSTDKAKTISFRPAKDLEGSI
jgi:DNA-binding protein HU-beta